MTEHMNPDNRVLITVVDDYRLRFDGLPIEGDQVRMSDDRIGCVVKVKYEGPAFSVRGRRYLLVIPDVMVNRLAFFKAGGACRFDEYLILPK